MLGTACQRDALYVRIYKTKEHYVTSENEDGKQTGWRADFVDGSRVEHDAKAKKSASA